MYDSSDDEYARRVANGGRGIPEFVSRYPPRAPAQPTTTGRFRFRPISTGGLPKGYKRKEKENAGRACGEGEKAGRRIRRKVWSCLRAAEETGGGSEAGGWT